MQDKRREIEEDEIDLVELLCVILKRWWIVAASAAAGLLLGGFLAYAHLPVLYSSSVTILPPTGSDSELGSLASRLGDVGQMFGIRTGGEGMSSLNLCKAMLKSRRLLREMATVHGLPAHYEMEKAGEKFTPKDYISAGSRLRENTEVEETEEGLIKISVDDPDPEYAARLANGYIGVLKQLKDEFAKSDETRRREFLEQRIRRSRKELAEAEAALQTFQKKHKTLAIEQQAEAVMEAVKELKKDYTAREVELGVEKKFATSEAPEVRRLEETLHELEGQIRKLERGENRMQHPDPTENEVLTDKTGTPTENPEDRMFIPLMNIPEIGMEYARLFGELQIQRKIFELLRKEYELAKIEEQKHPTVIKVMDSALVPVGPSKPRKKLVLAISLFTSFFLGVFLCFVVEFVSRIYRDPERRAQIRQYMSDR